ncbi:sterol desaturase family protein [Pseudolabrys sp. FHR47]|uniref:sterol desaturase family protein n=1 Tax=Pseudolabrys sp. FHR47 TaxID=2562284 RepID=UPI0010BE9A4F|nr:sterol desaturase family protein [Pseudolabrys sp. FHR47]
MNALSELGPHSKLILPLLAAGLMLVEYLFHKVNHLDHHDARETAVSLFIAVGGKMVGFITAGAVLIPAMAVYQLRLFDIRLDNAWAWIALFVVVDFCYYVHHVAMHKVRWFWATHSVHHSPTRLNLSAAVRLGWGGHLTGGFLFYLPPIALGFSPAAVFGMLGLGLLYQFFLHLARAPHLGPLEWVLNTPRHHQVHHASNEGCLDRNFGGVLIVFDRLCGTFAEPPRHEPLRYGLVHAAPGANPVRVLFGVWADMVGRVRRAKGLKPRLRILFGAPD